MSSKWIVERICFDGDCIYNTEEKCYYAYDKYDLEKLCEILNTLEKENEQLRTQLQNTSDQRSEFHRAARENANRVGNLEKENEALKLEIKELQVKNTKQLVDYNGLGCEYDWLKEENEQAKSLLHYLLNVIQNKCPKYYPACKEIVRNYFENDFYNIENDELEKAINRIDSLIHTQEDYLAWSIIYKTLTNGKPLDYRLKM